MFSSHAVLYGMTPTPADDLASALLSLITLLGVLPPWLCFSHDLLGVGADRSADLFKRCMADTAAVFTVGGNIMYRSVRFDTSFDSESRPS